MKANQKSRENTAISSVLGVMLMLPILALVITFMVMFGDDLGAHLRLFSNDLAQMQSDVNSFDLEIKDKIKNKNIIWKDDFEDYRSDNYDTFLYWKNPAGSGDTTILKDTAFSAIHSLQLKTPNTGGSATIKKQFGGRTDANEISIEFVFTIDELSNEDYKIIKLYETTDNIGTVQNGGSIKIGSNGQISVSNGNMGSYVNFKDVGTLLNKKNGWHNFKLVIDFAHSNNENPGYVSLVLNDQEFEIPSSSYSLENSGSSTPKTLTVEITSQDNGAQAISYIDDFILRELIDYTVVNNPPSPPSSSPPTASFIYTTTGLTADFTDTSTDTDGTISSWAWDFGDTSTSTLQNPTHIYGSDNTYTVSLTVTDDDGDTDTTTQTIIVRMPIEWPMFHYNVERTGYKTDKGDITAATVGEKWSRNLNDEVWSSPAIGDVDNDGNLEVVVGSTNDHLYCFNANDPTDLKWEILLKNDICSSPTLFDVNGDGILEVFIGDDDGHLDCLRGDNGFLIWEYDFAPLTNSFESHPVVGDITGDGDIEVVIGVCKPNNNLICLDAVGNGDTTTDVIWTYSTGSWIISPPSLYDIDSDGDLDVFVGDMANEKLYCYDGDGSAELWSVDLGNYVYWSAPAIADLDNDGTVEIIIGTTDDPAPATGEIICVDHTGSIEWRYGSHPCRSTAAIADITGDGNLEVVAGFINEQIVCLKHDGSLIWTTPAAIHKSPYASPIVNDIDNDNDIEVIVGGDDGDIYCLFDNNGDGIADVEWSYSIGSTASSPALADVDSDSFLELIVSGRSSNHIYCIDNMPSTTISWAKHYGVDGEYDWPNNILETSDGGYIVVGHSGSWCSGGGESSLMMKVDSDGNQVWIKTGQDGGSTDELLRSVIEVSDGYVAAGSSDMLTAPTSDTEGYVVKTDFNGNEIWSKAYGDTGYHRLDSIKSTSDNGFITIGTRFNMFGGYNSIILKLDSNGDIEWDKEFRTGSEDWGRDIVQTSDNGYMMLIETGHYGDGKEFVIMKLDSNGNQQWAKAYGGTRNEVPEKIVKTTDGGYIISGHTRSFGPEAEGSRSNGYAIKIDSSGSLEWAKTYGGMSGEGHARIDQTSDGGYALFMHTNSFGPSDENYMTLKLDSNGNQQWAKVFGGSSEDFVYSGHQTSDGGYVLAGSTTSNEITASSVDIVILKMDSNGDIVLPCSYNTDESTDIVTDSTLNTIVTDISDSLMYGISLSTTNIASAFIDVTGNHDYEICPE